MKTGDRPVSRMPFGKYKGQELCNLPDDYLQWLWRLGDLREPLLSAVNAEVERRDCGRRELFRSPALQPPPLTDELIEAGLRALARKMHPDVGGSNDAMRAALEAPDWLRRQVRELSA